MEVTRSANAAEAYSFGFAAESDGFIPKERVATLPLRDVVNISGRTKLCRYFIQRKKSVRSALAMSCISKPASAKADITMSPITVTTVGSRSRTDSLVLV